MDLEAADAHHPEIGPVLVIVPVCLVLFVLLGAANAQQDAAPAPAPPIYPGEIDPWVKAALPPYRAMTNGPEWWQALYEFDFQAEWFVSEPRDGRAPRPGRRSSSMRAA